VISASIRPPNAITDFLYRALAGGALGVEELEIKARATGLLGERQQIQHAKAFKKAKKALGIRSIRAGFGSSGKWAWLMPPQTATEIDPVANASDGFIRALVCRALPTTASVRRDLVW
jgi:hypothetical protein